MRISEEVIHRLDAIYRRLGRLEGRINRLVGMSLTDSRKDAEMGKVLDKVKQEVTEVKDVNASIKKLVAGLAQEIRDSAGDEDAILALADELSAETDSLQAAVVENTKFSPSGQ